MNAKKKALALVLCAVTILTATAFSTLAYLTDTDSVTNTFTVGKVEISMDEVKVDKSGVAVTNAQGNTTRETENDYHLLPGHKYVKDPTIHVQAGSEDCWLFVDINNQIAAIETKTAADTVAGQMAAEGWTLVAGETTVYAYKETVSAEEDVKVFSSFTIDGAGVDNTILAAYAGKQIIVTAYAVQADGFATADAAWTAADFN